MNAIVKDIRNQVDAALDSIVDQRTRDAVQYLVESGTLHQYIKLWRNSARTVILSAMQDGETVQTGIMKEAQRLYGLELAKPLMEKAMESQKAQAEHKAKIAQSLAEVEAERIKAEKRRLEKQAESEQE